MKLLLLDGNSLTYRAFFALPTDMATASGQVTNAVFGFTSMLINLLKDHKPDGIMVAFDRPEPTFRHEMNVEYKAQREAAPDILRQQMGLVRQVLEALRITIIELPGYEADDVIATISENAKNDGHDIIIVTGDRDTYQLVCDPHVKVLYNRRGVSDYAFYDEAGIFERTGVTPAQYVDYAAMRGDPSDNLPGIPGVGEKTAAKLINTYGGLDGIFANVDKQTPKLRQNLVDNEDRARSNAAADGAAPRCAHRGARPRRVDRRSRRGRDAPAVRLPRVQVAARPAVRGAGRGRHRRAVVDRRGAARRGHRGIVARARSRRRWPGSARSTCRSRGRASPAAARSPASPSCSMSRPPRCCGCPSR